jgi:hypothetical protein
MLNFSMKRYLNTILVAAVAFSFATAGIARADEPTAFQLIKRGDHYVGDDVKGKVVQIRSEKSVGSLTPTVWYVVYYDPDATFKATEVKFGAGEKLDVKRPMRVLEFGNDASHTLDPQKLKTDSDRALEIASKDALFSHVKLDASQMWLEHGDEGPTWKVRLWAESLAHPDHDVDIGDIYILAENGSVLRRDIHIDRVN